MAPFQLDLLPEAPWFNGGGSTREIGKGSFEAAIEASEAAWDWRLSVAAIDKDGPFSTLQDIDRVAVLVEGALTLESETWTGSWHACGDVRGFSGDLVSSARLHTNAARLFNVMTRREHARAQVLIHRRTFSLTESASSTCLLALNGSFYTAAPTSLLKLDAGCGVLYTSKAIGEVVMLSPAGCLAEVRLYARD